MRQQQPVGLTKGYQYNQLSLSQSPDGPTYTKLNAGSRQNVSSYYSTSPVNTNLWGWQGDQMTKSGVNTATPTTYPVYDTPISKAPQMQEHSDIMLQMLDQNILKNIEELNI